jgi:hypothetical protein
MKKLRSLISAEPVRRRKWPGSFLTGKTGGAFDSYTHSGKSVQMIFDTMQHVFKMEMVNLGPLNLEEQIIDGRDGVRACQK